MHRTGAEWLTSHAAEDRCEVASGASPPHPHPVSSSAASAPGLTALGPQAPCPEAEVGPQGHLHIWCVERGWSPTVLTDSSHWDHGLRGAERVSVHSENSRRPIWPCFLNFIKSPTEKLIFVSLPIDKGTESLQRCCKTLSTSTPHTVLFIFNLVRGYRAAPKV